MSPRFDLEVRPVLTAVDLVTIVVKSKPLNYVVTILNASHFKTVRNFEAPFSGYLLWGGNGVLLNFWPNPRPWPSKTPRKIEVFSILQKIGDEIQKSKHDTTRGIPFPTFQKKPGQKMKALGLPQICIFKAKIGPNFGSCNSDSVNVHKPPQYGYQTSCFGPDKTNLKEFFKNSPA